MTVAFCPIRPTIQFSLKENKAKVTMRGRSATPAPNALMSRIFWKNCGTYRIVAKNVLPNEIAVASASGR